MVLLHWLWPRGPAESIEPTAVYYTLRIVMFCLSFVLEDWAIHELVHSPKFRRQAVVLVASSYVTWTYQTHTFSNSVETLLVLWSLVLIDRISREKVRRTFARRREILTPDQLRSSITPSIVLGFLLVFGTFNRITFPAFVVIPGIQLLPRFHDR